MDIDMAVQEIESLNVSFKDIASYFWLYLQYMGKRRYLQVRIWGDETLIRVCVFAKDLPLHKICENTDFHWPLFFRRRTESTILSLYWRMQVSENLDILACILAYFM